MANKYFDPKTFIPFTLVKAGEVSQTEAMTEAAFDLLPEPILNSSVKGFVENFHVLQAPQHILNVVRVADVLYNSYLYAEAQSTDGVNYYANIDPGPSQLKDGLVIYISPQISNKSRAYLNLNNTGMVEILAYDNRPLQGGELLYNTIVCLGYYNGHFQLLNQSSNLAPDAPCDGYYYVRKDCQWWRVPDLTIPEASDLIFDDSNTCLKGENVQVFCEALDQEACSKVYRTGDTMTGNLTISRTVPAFILQAPNNQYIREARWLIDSDDALKIQTFNQYGERTDWVTFDYYNKDLVIHEQLELLQEGTADNHAITRGHLYGNFVPRSGGTFTGKVTFDNINPQITTTPREPNDIVNVAYVSSIIPADFVPISGGTFTGPVEYNVFPWKTGAGDQLHPTSDEQFATKAYVDFKTGTIGGYMPLTGGVFTGQVIFMSSSDVSNPTAIFPTFPSCPDSIDDSSPPDFLVNKAYVDSIKVDPNSFIKKAGDSGIGTLTLTDGHVIRYGPSTSPTLSEELVNLGYLESQYYDKIAIDNKGYLTQPVADNRYCLKSECDGGGDLPSNPVFDCITVGTPGASQACIDFDSSSGSYRINVDYNGFAIGTSTVAYFGIDAGLGGAYAFDTFYVIPFSGYANAAVVVKVGGVSGQMRVDGNTVIFGYEGSNTGTCAFYIDYNNSDVFFQYRPKCALGPVATSDLTNKLYVDTLNKITQKRIDKLEAQVAELQDKINQLLGD